MKTAQDDEGRNETRPNQCFKAVADVPAGVFAPYCCLDCTNVPYCDPTSYHTLPFAKLLPSDGLFSVQILFLCSLQDIRIYVAWAVLHFFYSAIYFTIS